MSRKASNKDEKLWNRAKWTGFVNVSLNSQEKKAVKDALLSPDECFQFILDAATDGYKVSLSYSIPEDVYTVSLTGVYQNKPNAGITMSMRHRSADTALSAVAWCHEEAGKNGEWSDRFGSMDKDDW